VVAALAVTLLLRPALTTSSDPWDLRNFTTEVVIKDGGSNLIPPGGTVTAGENYTISISFKEKTNFQFEYDSYGHLVYQLPPNIVISTAVNNASIIGTGSSNPVIGHYNITTGGLVTVWFDNVYTDGTSAPGNFIDVYTNANFKLDILGQFSGSGGGHSFEFGNNIIIDLNLEEPPVPAAVLRVHKNSTAYNPATNSINYTVTLTAENGTFTISRFSDWARKTSPNQNLGALPNPGYINLASVVVRNNGATVPTSQYSIAWRAGSNPPTFDIDFNSPVTLASGRSMTITYTMNLADFIAANCDDGDFYFNVHNQASVTYKDPDNNTKTATDTHDVGVSRSLTGKSGSYNSATGKITWTVTIGDGKINLAGAAFTDTLGAGIEASARPSSVNMTLRTTSSGAPVWSGPVATVLGSGKTFTFQVPSSPSPVYYATITYTTDVNPNVNYPSGGQYYNNVNVTLPGGGTSSAGGGVFIAREGKIEVAKTGRFLDENTAEWTITVNVPGIFGPAANGGTGVRFYLQDWIEGDFSGDVEAENLPVNMTVKVNGEAVTEGAMPIRWRLSRDTAMPSRWMMYFNNATSTANSRWPLDEDVQLEITYTQNLSEARLVDQGTNRYIEVDGCTTLLEYVKSDPEYAVVNTIIPFVDKNTLDPASVPTADWRFAWLSWPVWKNNKTTALSGNDTIFTYEVILNANESSTWWHGGQIINKDKYQLFPNGGPAPFFDEFDERLVYVPGSFKVEVRTGNQTPYGNTVRGTYKYPSGQDVEISGHTLTADLSLLEFVFASGTNDGANWYTTDSRNMVISYQMKLPDGKDILDQITLKNTAGIEAGTNKITGHFTNNCEVTYGKKAVTKCRDLIGNMGYFDIVVNPNGVKLDGGHNLCVTDRMFNTLAFYLTSIKVWTESVPRSGVFNTPMPLIQTLELDPETAWTWCLSGNNEITIVIPDETPVKIEYEALIKGAQGENVRVENYVEVSGKYYDEIDEYYIVQEHQGSGGGSIGKFLLFKNDANNPKLFLPGARFALYIGWKDDHWAYGATPPEDEDHIPITDATFEDEDGYTYYYLDNKWTDSTGAITFNNLWLTAESVRDGAKILVREIKPPLGYEIPPGGPDTVVDLFTATGTDYIAISNTPKDAPVTINGKKLTPGAPASPPPPLFSFKLLQVTNAAGVNPVIPLYQRIATSTGAGEFDFTITGLTPDTYYYMITESPNPSPGNYWTYDETIYIIKVIVSVDGDGELVSSVEYRYKTEESGDWSAWSGTLHNTVTFSNSYFNPSSVTVMINALKNTVGAAIGTNQFDFELYDLANWRLLRDEPQTVRNGEPTDEEGMTAEVHFDPLVFTTPGEYEYILTETGSHEGWMMDATRYRIVIVVEEAEETGELTAEVLYVEADEDGDPLDELEREAWMPYDENDPLKLWPSFTNRYGGGPVFPEVGGIGKTIVVAVGIAIILSAAATLVLYKHRKRRKCLTQLE